MNGDSYRLWKQLWQITKWNFITSYKIPNFDFNIDFK